MPRARKTGDKYYNARRRYQRSAERNMKMAEQTSGAASARYRKLARQDLNKALDTYDQSTTQEFSKPIRALSAKLGVDLDTQRQRLKAKKEEAATKARDIAEQKSTQRLESAMKDAEVRRQQQAKVLFSSDIGSYIIGSTVDIWHSQALENGKINKKKMMQAIFKYYDVDNLADLILKVEEQIGDLLYSEGSTEEIYETVKLSIQNKIADNELVA